MLLNTDVRFKILQTLQGHYHSETQRMHWDTSFQLACPLVHNQSALSYCYFTTYSSFLRKKNNPQTF